MEKSGPQAGSDRRRLLWRRDDAVESGVLRHPRQRHHLLEQRPLHADARQRGVVHAREHGDADDERPAAGLRVAAVSAAARAAACIIGTPPDACTLSIQTPVDTAASTACATVFGMS